MFALLPSRRPAATLFRSKPDIWDRFWDNWRLDDVFNGPDGFVPRLDVTETDDQVIVRTEVPGVDQKDIRITFTQGLLTIKGEKHGEASGDTECCRLRETRSGSFSRTVRMPSSVNPDTIDASYKDGVLTIKASKSESEKPKKIEITG